MPPLACQGATTVAVDQDDVARNSSRMAASSNPGDTTTLRDCSSFGAKVRYKRRERCKASACVVRTPSTPFLEPGVPQEAMRMFARPTYGSGEV